MAFERNPLRKLPDGTYCKVFPFHISFMGMEKIILCRDDDDYDAFVKHIFVCAKRKNVIVIIYAVVSNHAHVAILASDLKRAKDFGEEVKRIYSMWFNHKYRKTGVLAQADINVQCLDSDWYVRNALAYIPRNALDNGETITDYPWTGFRAMFLDDDHTRQVGRKVSSLSKREREKIFHTNTPLRDVCWLIDSNEELIPSSACDHAYLEAAFNNSNAFFLATIGSLNSAELTEKLVDTPRQRQTDSDFLLSVNEISTRWFHGKKIDELSLEQKIRLIPFIYRTRKTSIKQLARTFGLERKKIAGILGIQERE